MRSPRPRPFWRHTATCGIRSPVRSGTSPDMRSHSSTGRMTAAKLSPGSALLAAGELAQERGEYIEASAAFEAALDDADPLIVATAHNCLGKLSWQTGAFDAAFASFEKARVIALRHDSLDVRSRAEIGLGNVYYAWGDYPKARELYESVQAIAPSASVRGKVLLNLGAISNIEGDIQSAERNYRRACKAFADA